MKGDGAKMERDAHVRINRARWNQDADDYQRRNASQIRRQAFSGDIEWGLWAIPESQLGVLGEVAGKDEALIYHTIDRGTLRRARIAYPLLRDERHDVNDAETDRIRQRRARD